MGGRAPRVSVVMSVHNGGEHVREALDSILQQSFEDFELLVVDDGSTDGTADTLRNYTDARLRVLTQENRGYIVAWEHALTHATADLVARMDADDISRPDRFAHQVAFLDAHPEVGLLGTGGRVIDGSGASVREHETFHGDFGLRLALLQGNPFLHGSVMYRRPVFDAVGGYRRNYYPAEDYDLWCRMAAVTRVANLADLLYCYRVHGTSVSATEQRKQVDVARAVRQGPAGALRDTVLTPEAVRRAADAYRHDPDPRIRAEWPEVIRRLELGLVREARAGRPGPALRAFAATLAVEPTVATRVGARELLHAPARRAAARRKHRGRGAAPDRTLHVIFVLDSLGPGGTERSTALLLEPLRRRGIAAEVVCLRHTDEGDEARVRHEGFPVHVLTAGTTVGRIMALRARIRATRPDLVHTAIYAADVVGRIAAYGTGVPVVSSLISTPYDPARRTDPCVTPWKLAVARLVDGFTARHGTARLHAVSEGTATANCRDLRLDPGHVSVVERGRPVDEFTPVDAASRARARQRLGLDGPDRVIVSLGRHAFPKAFPDLLRAAPALFRDVPQARILIAGAPGPATPEIEAVHRALPEGIRERVEILGYRTDIPDLLHAGDVFVMTSRWEGTAGAVLEAMACGLPVVATHVEGLRGVVADGHNALVVPVGDGAALADALRRVLTDASLARTLGDCGRRTFVDRFMLEPSVDAMAALYRDVVTQGPRPRPR